MLTLIFFCLDVVTGVWYTYVPNFAIYLFLWCKEQPWPLSPDLGLWRTQEVTDWGLETWSWFNFGHWSLIQPCSKFWLSILILKVKRTTMSLSPDMGFGRCRRFLYRVWHLGLDLDIVTGLWYTHFQNFGSILILKVQRTSISFKSWLGAFKALEVPDWGLSSWSWFIYGNWSLVDPCPTFWLSILI